MNITIPNPIRQEKDGKVFYNIEGFRHTITPDMPMLPMKRYFLEIPNDAKDIKVRLIDADSTSLGIIDNIALSKPISIFTNSKGIARRGSVKSSQIFSKFPSAIFSFDGIVQIGDHKLVSISVYPLQCNLESGELTFYNNISIVVEYNSERHIKEFRGHSPFEKLARSMIHNYQQAEYSSVLNRTKYIIITDSILEPALQPLKNWKTKKGIPAEIYTTDWIYQNYPYTENFVFYSGNGHDLNNLMQLSINLTNVTTANLSFSTKYNIEYGWDFGYIEISTDGENWTHLTGNLMTDYRKLGAYVGDENVSSYTGNTTWVKDMIHLDNWTGNLIYLRFRYVTDTFLAYDGWFIDNISVNTDKGILLYNNGTNSENFTLSGFSITREQTESKSIREFIRDKADEGAEWILLAGDIDRVPTRYVQWDWNYNHDTHKLLDNDSVPTDYYYASLNGTWDSEWLTDIPDVYIGRLPTSNLPEIQSLIDKIINYEKNPTMNNSQWFRRAVLAGGVSDAKTDEAYLMELIKNNIIPKNFNVTRLYYSDVYEKEYDLNYDNFEIQTGIGESIVNWGGHGSYYGAAVNGGDYFVDTETDPENDAMLPLVYADSCLTGAFDQENCLGEVVLKNWGIGYIGASQSSYYTENWTLDKGFNQELNYRFWEQFFDGCYSPGEALYNSKIWYILNQLPLDAKWHGDDAARKNLITYNLLGDPEIPIWTSVPENFTVEFPEEIYTGDHSITITVKNSTNGSIENAVVCIQGSGIYNYGNTDSSGEIRFNLTNLSVGKINITLTKHNFLPYEGNISVIIPETTTTTLAPDRWWAGFNWSGFGSNAYCNESDSNFSNLRCDELCQYVNYSNSSFVGCDGFHNETANLNHTSIFNVSELYLPQYDSMEYVCDCITTVTTTTTTSTTSTTISPTTYTCNSCSDCNEKIQNASAGDTVYLTANITNQTGTCIEFNNTEGIILDCQGNGIEGNLSEYGVYLQNSSKNAIRNCRVYLFYDGIFLDESSNNTLTNNTVNNNSNHGIFLEDSNNNTLMWNTANNNIGDGFYLHQSNANILTQNIVKNNSATGIYISVSSKNNNIYHNNIINNSPNAHGNSSNLWDNGEEGNYWSDYSGIDSDGDGIGDTPYNISGGENQDNYPLMEPYAECTVKGDSNCDGKVSDFELLAYISLWVRGSVPDFDLLAAIDNWAKG